VARIAFLILLLAWVPACWPGKCGGAIRGVNPQDKTVGPKTRFWLNMDTNEKDGTAMLTSSGISTQTIVLEGPSGPVPFTLSGSIATSAHSCASAGSISIQPVADLAPGTYVLAVLLDVIRWPAIDDDAETFRGHRAIVRRFTVN